MSGFTVVCCLYATFDLLASSKDLHSIHSTQWLACVKNMDTLYDALAKYARLHGGRLPSTKKAHDQDTWAACVVSVRTKYENTDHVLFCPHVSSHRSASDYEFNTNFYGKSWAQIEKGPKTWLFREVQRNHRNKRNVIYSNGDYAGD